MQRYWMSLALGGALLLLALGLIARDAAPVAAAPWPPLATPKSAHFQLEAAHAMSDPVAQESAQLSLVGSGDIDTTRKAARLVMDLTTKGNLGGKADDTRLHLEAVQVDGRIYWLDPEKGRWEWTDATAVGMDALLFPSLGDLTGPPSADMPFSFVRVGSEVVDGAPTTHWRADLDLARAFGATPPASPVIGTPPDLVLTCDVWVGDANNYLYRAGLTLKVRGTTAGQTFSMESTATLVYSNHDRPVTILAPAGATPASSVTDLTGQLPASLSTAAGSLSALRSVPAFSNVTNAVSTGNGVVTVRNGTQPGAPSTRPRSVVVGAAASTSTPKVLTNTPTTRPATATTFSSGSAAARATAAGSSAPAAAVALPAGAQVPDSAQVPHRAGGFPVLLGLAGSAALLVLASGCFLLARRNRA